MPPAPTFARHGRSRVASADYLAATLGEPANCTVWHFSDEERLMLKRRYPAMAAHRQARRGLVEAARDGQAELAQTGFAVAEGEIAYRQRWLTEPILGVDREPGSFLTQVA